MQISLFFLSCTIAIFFLICSNRTVTKWIKNTFIIYSVLFTVTAFAIGTTFIIEHRTIIESALINFINNQEVKNITPPEPLISEYNLKSEIKLEAPLIKQLPELPRGCEITSLAMLLQYNNIKVDKMELAKKIKKDETKYKKTNEGIFFGNPNNGFVGDMYSFEKPGLGVYHKPITELAQSYAGDDVYDLTGEYFSAIIDHLNQNRPVWVIINATYKKLPESYFETWYTSDGPVKITMKEHSVLITGYDQEYIYFNDPLNRDQKAPIENFKEAWIQMGKQAITIL